MVSYRLVVEKWTYQGWEWCGQKVEECQCDTCRGLRKVWDGRPPGCEEVFAAAGSWLAVPRVYRLRLVEVVT